MKKVIAIVVFLAAFGLLATGCGPSQAQIDYVKQIQKAVTELFTRFEKAEKAQGATLDPEAFARVAADARVTAASVEASKAPEGLEKIKKDAVKLMKLIEQTSVRMSAATNYALQFNKSLTSLQFNAPSTKKPAKFAKAVRKTEAQVNGSIAELQKLVPPPSYSALHGQMVGLLKEFSAALDAMATATERRQANQLLRAAKDVQEVANKFDGVKVPENDKLMADILSEKDRKEIDRLEESITKQAKEILGD